MAGYVNAGVDDGQIFINGTGSDHNITKPGTYVFNYLSSGTSADNLVVASGVFSTNGGATAIKVVDAAGNLSTGTQTINLFSVDPALTFNGATGTSVASQYGTLVAVLYTGSNFNVTAA